MNTETIKGIEWVKIKHDVNGNPRYVCHYLNFIYGSEYESTFPNTYEVALKRAKKLGGKKFDTKQYGGGIVFQSYNLSRLTDQIKELVYKETRNKNQTIKDRCEIRTN